jgi:hypothetical protein
MSQFRQMMCSGCKYTFVLGSNARQFCIGCGSADIAPYKSDAPRIEDATDWHQDTDLREDEDEKDQTTDDTDTSTLGDIVDQIEELTDDDSLPGEGGRRLLTVQGLLEEVEDSISDSTREIANAAKSRDLAGLFTVFSDMAETVTPLLKSAVQELDQVSLVDGLDSETVETVNRLTEELNGIREAGLYSGLKATDDDNFDGVDPETDQDGGENPGVESKRSTSRLLGPWGFRP